MCESISSIEACEFLQCTESKLQELLREGQLPGLKFGKAWVIPRVAFFNAVNDLARRSADEMQEREGEGSGSPATTASGHHRGRPRSPWNAPDVERTAAPAPRSLLEWLQQEEEFSHRGVDVLISPWGEKDGVPIFAALSINSLAPRGKQRKQIAGGSDLPALRRKAREYADKLADQNEANAHLANKLHREPGA